ncbi:MAG: hypothetical protein LBF40_10345 [Deltaproteobacteria bacterium]|jgi:hydroxyacyl-ACP dehydratase HTD2-like protein with hotdog domain|nr:hypothetical protein [Deltaproteobacteria bacterium]
MKDERNITANAKASTKDSMKARNIATSKETLQQIKKSSGLMGKLRVLVQISNAIKKNGMEVNLDT